MCGDSCCTKELEKEAYKYNQILVDKYIRSSISKVSSILDIRARKFDEHFQGMMKQSKKEFHEMFERTYGKIYLQNSDVFIDFFVELETYYRKGTVRLSETMDTFFGILYQRMFKVINAQYMFDDAYLECVSGHMTDMKPFGDVPHKLGIQLRRSFVATRTFHKALVRGAEAADRLADLKVNADCYAASAAMRYCGACRGQQESGGGVCSGYCTKTMQGCFGVYGEVSPSWDSFVDAIDKVSERLLGPYNIEIVVEPLNIKISEAIMNFQESGLNVSRKIYSLCGKPPQYSRPKRDGPPAVGFDSRPKREGAGLREGPPSEGLEIEIEPMRGTGGRRKHKKTAATVESRSALEKIILDIKQKIKETKQFWLNLPYQYCNNLSLLDPSNDTAPCWNGTNTSPTPTHPRTSDAPLLPPLLSEQTFALQGLTDKLRKAHQGQEVEMVDDTEEVLDGSGSGSGDGDEEDDVEPPSRPDEKEEEEEDRGIVFTAEEDGRNNEVVAPVPSSTREPEVVRASGGARTVEGMSLQRALVCYLVPIVLAWFGGAITNLL
ncbi:unnamed protein product [Phaedon cochleariae]|uniref:Glypican-6 n=1 Tax=Phaedon cochleariae TaxID=80249 RepID=A0A9N9X4P9_PHACE|nr:unnamed protein product [Phaedon cochleariae]